MEIQQICTDLINFLNSGKKLVKDFIEKNEKIESFYKVLSKQDLIQDFIKSSYIADVVQAVLNVPIVATQNSKFKSQNFEAIPNFFLFFAESNIPLAKEENDIGELVKIMIDIITIVVPKADNDYWTFWLKVFINILKIPTFYDLFRENFDDDALYIKIDSLFALITSLMKFSKINNADWYSEQRSLALNLFSVFLEETPYPPSPSLIKSIFNMSDELIDLQLNENDFNSLLTILNELIALSPISFLINSSTAFNAPFNEKIMHQIYDKWHEYQTISSIRKSSSAYLLLFLTTMEALNYDISSNLSEQWVSRILDVWSKFKNRDKIFKSSEYIPYFRADIEFLKRSKDSVSECLLTFILQNNKINQNSNIIWLFTAIGLYEPGIVQQEDWLQILGAINSFNIGDAVWRNQQSIPDFYNLISVMVDIIESKSQWNNVFTFLIENQPSKEPISAFFLLVSKILSEQKIDTKIAHQYQHLFWKDKSNPDNYSLEKIRCIHILIYYYGFANIDSRNDCFNTLICVLDTKDDLSNEYLKQLAVTICSIISSHPFPFIPIKPKEFNEETIDDVCNKLKQQLEITTARKKIESPLQAEDLYFMTPESSQISVEEGPDTGTDSFSQSVQYNVFKPENNYEETDFGLCNFISKNIQNNFIKYINTKNIPNEYNECFFRLFITSILPNLFSPNVFFEGFKRSFNEKGNADTFPSFFKILLTIANEITDEDFQPFFEDIEESFFEIAKQYIERCDSKIQDFIKDNSPISWYVLNDISLNDYFNDLQLFAEFAVKCSILAVGTNDNFYNCFDDFLSTSACIPTLHLRICSYILNLSLSDGQKSKVISTLNDVTNNVLQVYLVPIKDRDNYIMELFDILKYEYNNTMNDLFKSIFKYPITPMMRLGLLNIMQNNYKKISQIFDILWEQDKTPFFIDDEYPMIRLQSIDTIISILKLKELFLFNGYEIDTIKFDKDKFFKIFISPFIEEILNDSEWDKCKQLIFTALKTLIHIAAEIPELTTKALYIIFDSFTLYDFTIFHKQCIIALFSGLSTRIHFSLFLRQFIPMLIPQLDKLTERLASYPFDLFYYDESNVSKNEAKRMFCEKAAPFAIAYSIANSKQDLINFFTSALKKKQNEIIKENIFYIGSYLLEAIAEASSEEDKSELQNLYKSLMTNNKFLSPIPLLSFVSMASEQSIKTSYQLILDECFYMQEFCDIRHFIFMLYATIFKAHHELVQSYHLQQFSLYISILFEKQKDKFEQNPTLFSDILALTVNMLKFVPTVKSLQILLDISSNIPQNFNMKMIGFVKNIEDICINVGFHPCLDDFFEKFPKLINKILIFDFLKERQLENRTPLMEFKRIAKTRRLNQESINFLLPVFIEDSESIHEINALPNNFKRTVLNEIYKFAISNPQTLALHLYSEMFLNFIHIHPSPLVIDSDINAPSELFKKLIELARDKNPSISRSALTALHIVLSKSLLPKSVTEDVFLKEQLEQYAEYAHPRTKVKKPDENAPWICKFVCNFIEQMNEDQLCHAFGSIAAVSEEFCQLLFPLLFYECINCPLFIEIYDEFKHFSTNPKKYFEECKLFIGALNYLRSIIFRELIPNGPNWHLKWNKRQFDFKKIMEVCLKIGDPYSAYQFAEFAHEDIDMDEEPLNRIFSHIGIDDLKYGLYHDFSNPLSVAELHHQEGRFGKALILYDNGNDIKLMSNTLCELHLYNLLRNVKISLSEENIESLWRLRKWDVSSKIMREMSFDNHSASLFAVMQAFATNNEGAIIHKLSDFDQKFHFDYNSSVFTQLSYLLDASALQWFHAISFENSSKLNKLFPQTIINIYRHSLKKLNQFSKQFYKITESAIALHAVFLCILTDLNNASISLPANPPKFFSEVISNSLENKEIESAQYFITLLHENQKKAPQLANFEQIRVLYLDNPQRAVSLLKKNFSQILLKDDQLKSEKRKNVFNLQVEFTRASWCAHTNNLPSDQIYEQLKTVIEKCEQTQLVDLMADAEFTLARVYHRQHREICDYFMSLEYKRIIGIIKFEKECISSGVLPKAPIKNVKNDYNNYISIIKQYKELFCTTIVKAIENYMNALIHSSKYDLESTFSMIGLWFNYSYTKENQNIQTVPELIKTMKDRFIQINPIKFLPLFYQLAARVDDQDEVSSIQNSEYKEDFQIFLRQMVISICQKSPNDCYPVLFALEKNTISQNKKNAAIKNLITAIVSISTELSDHWEQMKYLLKSYVLLNKNKNILECTTDKMPYVSIITSSNYVGINHFKPDFTTLNGVNKPMLLKIIGTDGLEYKQVVKGNNDDLRQDAVMQQLFVLSSKLLSKLNPNLSIRYYKVIPILQTVGVIEFVQGSISIQDYLFKINEDHSYSGAHTRYYVNGESYPIAKAISEFKKVSSDRYHNNPHRSEEDLHNLIKYFKMLKKKLKPALHFFFIEKFTNTSDWFISRLRYCRHTATNSMVGHILGIGDRHLNNIMLDEKTGEVIHIDLGIAFDQGKILPVKENVPFRLTSEIIDGMGWMGQDGIFRKTCEETMYVLRNSAEYLLIVLGVFMSDPLINWIIEPRNQKSSGLVLTPATGNNQNSDEKNKFAESAIITCQKKLEGRETGEILSVEGQVAKLINDAASDENLEMMYHGWRPYL